MNARSLFKLLPGNPTSICRNIAVLICGLMMLGAPCKGADSATNSVSIEVDSETLRYRVCLRLANPAVRYAQFYFESPQPSGGSIVPRGAKVQIKDAEGKLIKNNFGTSDWSQNMIQCCNLDAYRPGFTNGPVSGIFLSDWFEIGPVIHGLEFSSGTSHEDWDSICVQFTMDLQDCASETQTPITPPALLTDFAGSVNKGPITVTGRSAWLKLPKETWAKLAR